MTFEEICRQENDTETSDSVHMHSAGRVLEEVLVSSRQQDWLTVGVYESAKVMNTWVSAASSALTRRPSEAAWKDAGLEKLSVFCEERRSVCEWVPTVTLPER
ncbi:growth arrest and DNA damage-inducible protein GADD45 gamma [Silurus asotus]|uniref:Growth arrest and DNA damage-inducible protein GADD45 gamma n=1 Tax=Silurus asotus TaxID=30991 RepID=A0AAD5AWC3_SILAS|nr:growth arrest and DNA damage-inducible protein GADD45 gamma [Silurus asotus]